MLTSVSAEFCIVDSEFSEFRETVYEPEFLEPEKSAVISTACCSTQSTITFII